MGTFILFLIVLFILAAVLRVDFFFTLLYLFIGIFILSHLWSRRALKNLHINRIMQPRAFLGDKIEVTLKLQNCSRLPVPWLLLQEVFPLTLSSPSFYRKAITLSGKGDNTTHYTLTAHKRGYYNIGPLSLYVGDLLGLQRETVGQLESNSLIIYPKIVPIARLNLPAHSPQVTLSTTLPLFRDPARPIGVRAYHPGDNPRHIHWPATAATGQMLVKQFQPAIARDNAIFLNLCRADYAQYGYPDTAIELAITVAASLANHMVIAEELPVGLVTTAIDPLIEKEQKFTIPPRKGRGHLMQILDILARAQAIETEGDFLERIRQESLRLSWGTTIVVITRSTSNELAETLLLLKRSGFQIALVLISPRLVFGRLRQEPMPNVDVPIYKIRDEKDIEIWTPAL